MSGSMIMDGASKVIPHSKDEKRMNVLYAPFRKKEMNPVDWESKMKYWHSEIENWCMEHNQASISIGKITREYKVNGRSPACIATVIEELIRCGQVKPKKEFMEAKPFQGWTSWAVNSFIKAPITRSVSMLQNYWTSDNSASPDTEFVHIPYLKERGEKLFLETETTHEKILTHNDIKNILSKNSVPMCGDTVNCVVHYLHLQGLVVVEKVKGCELVKLLRPGKSEIPQITKADIAVFQMQEAIAIVKKEAGALEIQKETCAREVKKYLAKGMNHSAKNALKKKHQLENSIVKKLQTLDNLYTLLESLRNTETETEILDAYKTGLLALKGVFKSSGLNEDTVFDTMTQVKEVLEINEDMQAALSENLGKDMDDEEDLEKELDDLMKMSEAEITKTPDAEITGLPDAESHELTYINNRKGLAVDVQTLSEADTHEDPLKTMIPELPKPNASLDDDEMFKIIKNLPSLPSYTLEEYLEAKKKESTVLAAPETPFKLQFPELPNFESYSYEDQMFHMIKNLPPIPTYTLEEAMINNPEMFKSN